MAEDERLALIEDLIEGLAGGEVARTRDKLPVERRDDGTVLEVDLGDPERVYVISVVNREWID